MTSLRSLGVVVCIIAGCGKSTRAPAPKALPAAAAGISTASGPGVPAGFSGTVKHTIELTDEERAAIEKANELSNPSNGSATVSSSTPTAASPTIAIVAW